jgi:hypothetical protein
VNKREVHPKETTFRYNKIQQATGNNQVACCAKNTTTGYRRFNLGGLFNGQNSGAKMHFTQSIEIVSNTVKTHCDSFITMVFLLYSLFSSNRLIGL